MLCNNIIPNGKSRDAISEHFTIIHLILLTKASLRGDDCPLPLFLLQTQPLHRPLTRTTHRRAVSSSEAERSHHRRQWDAEHC